MTGPQREVSAYVAALVRADIDLLAFTQTQTPLEALFFMLTDDADTSREAAPMTATQTTAPAVLATSSRPRRGDAAGLGAAAALGGPQAAGPVPRQGRPDRRRARADPGRGRHPRPVPPTQGHAVRPVRHRERVRPGAARARLRRRSGCCPLLTAIVAGDIFASEDQHGTWKTVLTRSTSRGQLFWAKTLTAAGFAVLVLVVLAASTIVSSLLIVGHQPLIGLSGQTIPAGDALRLVAASWATMLPPMLGFTCLAILLSVWSRNPAVGIAAPVVIGMVMQLVGALGGVEAIRPFLLTTPFEAWHGLLADPRFTGPLTEGLLTSAVWCALSLGAAFVLLRRRDITGG